MSLEKRVIVIGAGIKGLFVSRELCRLGYNVTIIERSNSAGGKIKTIRSPAGGRDAFSEMGAMRILESNKYTLQLLKDLEINVIPFIEDNENAPFAIKNQQGKMKNLNLGVLIDTGLVDANVVIEDKRLKRNSLFAEILDIAFNDAISLDGVGDERKQMKIIDFLSVPGKGATARKCAKIVLDLKFGPKGPHNNASVREFLKFKKLYSGKAFAVEGGFDKIIHMIVEKLMKHSLNIRLKSKVVTVDYTNDKYVNVVIKKIGLDRTETLRADAILFACPSLHEIQFIPDLPSSHRDIIHRTLYENCTPAMKSVLRFADCFWQRSEHGDLIGGTCWIGPSRINQIRLPPFHSEGEGYLMVYLLGESLNEWLQYSVEDRINECLEAIAKLFPSLEGKARKHFKDYSEVVWNEAGSGAYCLFNAESVRDALQPVNRLVFSPVPRAWIDDSLKDGKIAIRQIKDMTLNR